MIPARVISLTFKEVVLRFGTTEQNLCSKMVCNYAELVEFNHVELIYYKVGQSLLQARASMTKWDRY